MPKVFSSRFKQVSLAINANEPILILIEIIHSSLSQNVRFVNDSQDFLYQGKNYLAASFNITLINDEEKNYPEAKLEFSNVGQVITQFIEQSAGALGAKCRIIKAIRSNENPANHEDSFLFKMNNFSINKSKISCNLNLSDILNMPSQNEVYDPKNAAGLF